VRKRERPDGIAAAVRRVLKESSYADAARRFAATLVMEAAQRPNAVHEAEMLLS
jgi:hypothetical protein